MTIDPKSIAVGDRVQARAPQGDARPDEQAVGTVIAVDGDAVTFQAEGEYDMFSAPGDEDYFTPFSEPKTYTVRGSAITYHWARGDRASPAVLSPGARGG